MRKLTQILTIIVLKIGALPDKIYNRFWIKKKNVDYVTYPKIYGKIFLTGQGKIKMGRSIKLNSGIASNPMGGDSRLIISVAKNALLTIGDSCGISNAAIICHSRISIGNYVKIGGGTKIYDTDFHSLDPEKRKDLKQDVPNTKEVAINDNVFIGGHSIILKGVTIGENSIIGAGSVVTKSIPPNEIWGGNPVKFIKKI